jgi:hypothetical protein
VEKPAEEDLPEERQPELEHNGKDCPNHGPAPQARELSGPDAVCGGSMRCAFPLVELHIEIFLTKVDFNRG